MVSKQLVRVLARQANSLHASASHRRADAKGRIEEQSQACSIGRRSITAAVQSNDEGTRKAAFVGKQCSCECRPDRQTVRIRLALQSSRKLARYVEDPSRLMRCNHIPNETTPAMDDQSGKQLYPPRTMEQPRACSIGRRAVTARAAVQSNEEGGQPLLASSAPVSAAQTQSICVL